MMLMKMRWDEKFRPNFRPIWEPLWELSGDVYLKNKHLIPITIYQANVYGLLSVGIKKKKKDFRYKTS